ncbi:hypothetical protein LBMAG42_24210 [Deltaproteobacteria bacterium]|nr:hypothetical protein LBMAG42_24210 [Deltaproteobacteria bacterium]
MLLLLAAHVGPTVPLAPLAANASVRLEAGVVLPQLGGRIAPMLFGGYAGPVLEGESTDGRLGDGYAFTVVQKELTLGLGATVRLFPAEAKWNPELTIGPTVQFLETVASGSSAGGAIGTTTEHYAQAGFLVAAGAGVRLGPGALTVQVGYAGAGLDGLLTGESTTGAFNPTVGYRVGL